MIWGAHKADGRIAAKNSVKIRAAIRRSIDARQIFEAYQDTHPFVTDNNVQDRARARAWAMLHVQVDTAPIKAAIIKIWADGFLLGQDAANEAVTKARLATKSEDATVDWANWTPGNRAAALMLRPTGAFQKLLADANITSSAIAKVGYDRIGTALADSIAAGFSPQKAARVMLDKVGDPARALTIAITEQNRAMSLASMQTYQDLGLEKVEWSGANPCEICAPNEGQIVNLGDAFNSGDTEPPVHPNCRCAFLPVIAGMEDDVSLGQDFLDTLGGGAEPTPDYGLTGTYNGVNANELVDMATKAREYADTVKNSQDADPLLKGLYKQKGYEGLPTLIDKKEFNAAVGENKTIVYRGVNVERGQHYTELSPYVTQFKSGDYFAGSGVHGNGTYSSTNPGTGIQYANGSTQNVMSMVLSNNFKTISIDDIKRNLFTIYDEITAAQKSPTISPETGFALSNTLRVINDPGRLAAMLGYDGITVPVSDWQARSGITPTITETYYVILNRSKVKVLD